MNKCRFLYITDSGVSLCKYELLADYRFDKTNCSLCIIRKLKAEKYKCFTKKKEDVK